MAANMTLVFAGRPSLADSKREQRLALAVVLLAVGVALLPLAWWLSIAGAASQHKIAERYQTTDGTDSVHDGELR